MSRERASLLGTARRALDFLLPAACLGCGGRLPLDASAVLVCGRCLTRLAPPPSPLCRRCGFPLGTGAPDAESCLECRSWPAVLHGARSAYVLKSPADALVHALKYGGWGELAGLMGRRMARSVPAVWTENRPVVVPVPTTRARARRRGYNQAELLARVVAGAIGLRLVRALRRAQGGATQVALHPAQRRANVEHAFHARPGTPEVLAGMRALLVDDVLTTGATSAAAARALEEAGVAEVGLVTFARALPFDATGG